MKKILILNGSHSEISLIQEAKNLGYYVITSGNCPHLMGHQFADKYICADYSDKEKMLEIAISEKIDYICSCANDFGIITAAYIGEKLNLKGHDTYDTTVLLHQKDLFKAFCLENNILSPKSYTYDTVDEALSAKELFHFPVIIKPVDLTGGHGVSKVSSPIDYEQGVIKAFQKSKKKKIVIESFIEGTYHSFSTFIINKKVVAYFSDNEYPFTNPYGVATSCGPASNIDKVKDILIEQVEIIANKLNLVDGVFHLQYIMDSSYKPYIIDITRRCSGDLYPEPVEYSTNIPWSKWIILAETGASNDIFVEPSSQTKFCGRHCIMSKTNGLIKDVIISEELKSNIYKSVTWWKPGDYINNYILDKIGIIFYEFDSEQEMLDKISRIDELVKVAISD